MNIELPDISIGLISVIVTFIGLLLGIFKLYLDMSNKIERLDERIKGLEKTIDGHAHVIINDKISRLEYKVFGIGGVSIAKTETDISILNKEVPITIKEEQEE